MGRTRGAKNKQPSTQGLPKHLQVIQAKKRFNKLNPGVGSDVIDWESAIGRRENYHENLEDLKAEYPEYRWDRRGDPALNERKATWEDRRALEKSGYKVVQRRDYKILLQAYKARKQELANQAARAQARHVPTRSGLHRGSSELIKVRTHYRRFPRN